MSIQTRYASEGLPPDHGPVIGVGSPCSAIDRHSDVAFSVSRANGEENDDPPGAPPGSDEPKEDPRNPPDPPVPSPPVDLPGKPGQPGEKKLGRNRGARLPARTGHTARACRLH